jgi:hypothetical protein
MDFKERYLLRRVRGNNRDDNEVFLGYCFCISMAYDTELPIPSALIEDIIADVELMKGHSIRLGTDKFNVFEDVCISNGNDPTIKTPASYLNKTEEMVQVMLVHS